MFVGHNAGFLRESNDPGSDISLPVDVRHLSGPWYIFTGARFFGESELIPTDDNQ
jgi:hypothetical protein